MQLITLCCVLKSELSDLLSGKSLVSERAQISKIYHNDMLNDSKRVTNGVRESGAAPLLALQSTKETVHGRKS